MTGIARKYSASRYHEMRQLGIATAFLKQNGDFRSYLAEALDLLQPAIWHGQVVYFQDNYGTLRGVAFYASLTERVERIMLAGERVALHDTEWNEGERYWIVALAVDVRGIRATLGRLRAEMAKLTDVIYFRRMRPGRAATAWAVQTRGAPRPRRFPAPCQRG